LKVEYGGFQHTDLVDLNNATIDFLNLHSIQFSLARTRLFGLQNILTDKT